MAGQPPTLPPGAVFVPPPGPPTQTRPPNLLVLLHGRGDGPAPFARLAARLALPGTAALALRGPVPLGPGHTWWCDDEEDGDDAAAEAVALAAGRQALAAAIDGAGWPRHRVHLFGYGDGGRAALDLTVAAAAGGLGPGPAGSRRGGRAWGSAVTVSAPVVPVGGGLAPPDFLAGGAPRPSPRPTRPAPAGVSTPVLMTWGEHEPEAPAAATAALAAALRERWGVPDVAVHSVPGCAGGMLGRDEREVRAVMEHWARCLSGPVPEGCVEVE